MTKCNFGDQFNTSEVCKEKHNVLFVTVHIILWDDSRKKMNLQAKQQLRTITRYNNPVNMLIEEVLHFFGMVLVRRTYLLIVNIFKDLLVACWKITFLSQSQII